MFEITNCLKNKDDIKNNLSKSKDYYLDMYGDFKSKLPKPKFYPAKENKNLFILDFAEAECGLKGYGAEKYIAELDSDLIGYASVRVGYAPISIAYLCEMYNKKAVFFAAASKQISEHQAAVLAYKNSELRFARIPAMPTLNSWIRKWAEKHEAKALPFGLSGLKEVTSGLVKVCDDHAKEHGEPPEFHCAVSTGTMIRSFQIGWPNSKAVGTAVARNIKAGEVGNAIMKSYHKKFYQKSDYIPDFDTTETYDAKAYYNFLEWAPKGSVFINVGSDNLIKNKLKTIENWQNIDSNREWGDMEAFSYA